MTVGTATTDTRRGMPEKRRAIMRAARAVFGREGYTRAGVDTIALEAGVSNRTIYNHFTDKEQLFQTVALEGAEQVTAAISEILERHLRKIVDIREDLIAFGLERVAAVTEFPDHFALVRHIHAEADHVPPEVFRSWQEAGPIPVTAALTEAFQNLHDEGLLNAHGDAALTAAHFVALTSQTLTLRTHYGVLPLPEEESRHLLRGGVAAFLRAYRRADKAA